jgi:tRNA-specific 2-thiouridylase
VDPEKDQSYFLHAVSGEALAETVFPLGELTKREVRSIARDRGLAVHGKKDSTGICFIGERPFREFLGTYLPAKPGPIVTVQGEEIGRHTGLMYYTLGQRQGLGIGGRQDAPDEPWYVVDKALDRNALVVDQGDSPFLMSSGVLAADTHWIGSPPAQLDTEFHCKTKVRYRQADQDCCVYRLDEGAMLRVDFGRAQRAVAPGQFVVFYDDRGERCLGGGVIDALIPAAAQCEARSAVADC